MSKMTVHDRMTAVYKRELPDRLPVAIYNRYLPRGSRERTLRDMGLGIIDYHPVVTLLAPPWHTHAGYISEVKGVDLQINFSWENGQQIETRIYKTPVGTISQSTTKDPAYGSDWISKFYITDSQDYKIVQYVVEHTVFHQNEKAILAKIHNLGEDGIVWGRVDRSPYQKLLIELAGPEQFLVDLQTNPEPVTELRDAMDRRMDEVFEMTLESQVEIIWQPDNITADMTPPDNFKKYCVPFYEKHAKQLKAAGKSYFVHMDGRLGPLKDLIARCPFDAVESFSFPEVGGDLSLSEARSAWPDKIILPNFPSSLCNQSEEQIESFLDRLMDEVGTKVPFMLQVSEDIPESEWQRVLPLLCRFMESRAKAV
ncbi:MAG: hypothetical protein JSV03_00045 [Planctomycetota bacterium]|nr:MAG: hypothetical protein JSV03_00045 [Planctomycetota bacterium]